MEKRLNGQTIQKKQRELLEQGQKLTRQQIIALLKQDGYTSRLPDNL